ncbi:MAG: flagellar assembly protein A [Bacillota bacterium]
MTTNENGYVEVDDGEVKIKNPQGLGRYPRIEAGKNVELFIEGNLIKDEVVVSEEVEDKITIKIKKVDAKKELNLEINADKTKAFLKINIRAEQKLKLKDIAPANKLTIQTKVISETYPEVKKEEIEKLLNDYNICYGIKKDKINEIVNKKRNYENKYLIAEGKKAIKGKDAKIIKTKSFKEHKEKTFNTIESFEAGEVICFKKEAIPGKKGINIFNEEIPPPPVRNITLKAGDNVEIEDNNKKAVALKGGQPKIIEHKNTAIIKIVQQYVIDGDIDKNTGNIKYEGDLLVNGDIKDYFNVKVGHDLKVTGNIANTEVKTNGNVYIKNNIISSNLQIGNYLNPKIIDLLNSIIKKLENLNLALEEILGEASKRKLNKDVYKVGKIIKLLLENKFENLSAKILKVNDKIDKDHFLKKDLEKISPLLKNTNKLAKLKSEKIFIDFKNTILNTLKEREESKDILNIYTGYIQNSTININGSVFINKLGCYNSNIEAKNCIVVRNNSGFLKGGNYTASNLIYVDKAGNNLGKTHFTIGKRLYIKEATGTLIINSEQDRKVYDRGRKNINLKVNEFGKIIKAKTKPKINNNCED